jgi:hypothetical protein
MIKNQQTLGYRTGTQWVYSQTGNYNNKNLG